MARIVIDVPSEFSDVLRKENIFIMSLILAILIDRLIKSAAELEEVSGEDLKTIIELDNNVKESLLKHYLEDKT